MVLNLVTRSAPRLAAGLVATVVLLASAGPARADVIDLTSAGATVNYEGAIYVQSSDRPTGTGVIQPFLRIQMNGTEEGYNTDGPIQFDTKDMNNWTRSLPLNSLQEVTYNGAQYYRFGLDINENNGSGNLLSLNDLRIYLGNAPDLTGFNLANKDAPFGSNAVQVYNLDADGDSRVELDYNLGTGSGSNDMFVYIPVSAFNGVDGTQYPYVYLYSKFGNPNQSDAGFEEWWAQTGENPTTPIPAPPAVLLGLIGIGTCVFGRSFRRRAAATPV